MLHGVISRQLPQDTVCRVVCLTVRAAPSLHSSPQPAYFTTAAQVLLQEKKSKDRTFRHLFDEKPGSIPGCPNEKVLLEQFWCLLQAGGVGSTGQERVLDICPEKVHQRVPLFVGSPKEVEYLESFIKK